jgi:hypothetical protein
VNVVTGLDPSNTGFLAGDFGILGRIPDPTENRPRTHIFRSHRATDVGSNRTQVPMRNDGILPALACLKIVILETVNMLASSSAVKARPIRSIRSGSDKGCPVASEAGKLREDVWKESIRSEELKTV